MTASAFFPETDARIYKALAPLGLVLCGGYSRDMLLGRVPKDMDFIVLGPSRQRWLENNWERLIDAIEGLGGEVQRDYFKYSSNCACCIDFLVGDRTVQVIFPRLPAATPAECVALFQWNFNHAYFDPGLEAHVWAVGIEGTIRHKQALWMCSFECPELDPKYPLKFPDWDFSLYGGPDGKFRTEQVWCPC